MKKPEIIIIIISITIAFLFVSASAKGYTNAYHPGQHNCTYSIEVETTCAASAGTTDKISVRFGDSNGNLVLVKHLKNPKLIYAPREGAKKQGGTYSGFERCAIDMFEASGTCMSRKACYLYLKRFGSDEWRPGWVRVLRRQDDGRVLPVSYIFYFRTFVPENVWFGINYCGSNQGSLPEVVTSLEGEK